MIQHVLLVGCGSMGSAMARGLKLSHPDWKFSCYTPSGTRAKALALELGGEFVEDLSVLPKGITAVMLGFKPQMIGVAAPPLKTLLPETVPYISLLAAISLHDLTLHFPNRPLIRLMPNLSVATLKGVVLWEQYALFPEPLELWKNALSSLGLAPRVSEKLIDVYTIPGASSPAFLFQWLKDAGLYAQENGGDPQEAVEIFAQALRGTLSTPLKFSEMDAKITAVASKGGVTQAVLDTWEKSFSGYIKAGFNAGLQRIQAMKKPS